VSEVGIDVGKQVTHHRGNTGTHVLGWETREMTERERERETQMLDFGFKHTH